VRKGSENVRHVTGEVEASAVKSVEMKNGIERGTDCSIFEKSSWPPTRFALKAARVFRNVRAEGFYGRRFFTGRGFAGVECA
jgi:hypothetical protein